MRIAAAVGLGGAVAMTAAVLMTSLVLTSSAPASAQVRYAPRPDAPIDFFSPYDESYGVSPSYQINPYDDGRPAVRVIARCQYPDGWNVTDFGRDINGIPNGIEHTCPPSRIGGRLRSRY